MNRRYLNIVAHIWVVLTLVVISLNANATTIQYQSTSVGINGRGLTENSYALNGATMAAIAKANVAGKTGESHLMVGFKFVPDNGDTSIIKPVTFSLIYKSSCANGATTSYIMEAPTAVDYALGVITGGKLVQQLVTTGGANSTTTPTWKTNTLYVVNLSASVVSPAAAGAATSQITMIPAVESIVMPVASAPVVKLVSDTVPVKTAVAAIQAVAASCGTPAVDTTTGTTTIINTPTVTAAVTTAIASVDDDNNGHGNDVSGIDSSNPGKSAVIKASVKKDK